MGFWLKKLVSYWLFPLPLCLALLTIGIGLTFTKRFARLGRRMSLAALLLLAVFANKTFSVWFVQPFEQHYAAIPELSADQPVPADIAACRYVVILGSGHSDTAALSDVNKLCEAAQSRLLEALRLLRRLPEAKLVTCGPGAPGGVTHAKALENAAASLGFDRTRVIHCAEVQDTEDETRAVRQVVGDAPCLLVTSAWHLPRAMILARRAGLQAVPCPAGYIARQPAPTKWGDFLWDIESLQRSTAAVHEALGLVWVTVKPAR